MAGSRSKGQKTGIRSYRTVILAIVSIATVFGVLFYLSFVAGTRLVIDWRVQLIIYDQEHNRTITIPAGIGVIPSLWVNHTLDVYGPPGYAPLSTRFDNGTIYVQSVRPRLFLLREFFGIWGQPYNRTCVGYGTGVYCAGPGRPPPFIVSESPHCIDNPYPIPLDNGKIWEIIIGSSGVPEFSSSQCA